MISIIIPTYNEKKNIASLLTSLSSLCGEKEIIVVDGGSSDGTGLVAEKVARVIYCKKANRAKQMNQGANASRGELLWFLHADSKVCPQSLVLIEEALQKHSYGGFRLCFQKTDKFSLRVIAFFSNMRAQFFGIIFGDQAMFVRREFFFELGQFSDIELMEDFDFCRRAKKVAKPVILKEKIHTSASRFLKGGIWKTCLMMQYLKILYLCGVQTKKLQQIYYKK
jgi:rSAM/selenodomain-associated transferase 2